MVRSLQLVEVRPYAKEEEELLPVHVNTSPAVNGPLDGLTITGITRQTVHNESRVVVIKSK